MQLHGILAFDSGCETDLVVLQSTCVNRTGCLPLLFVHMQDCWHEVHVFDKSVHWCYHHQGINTYQVVLLSSLSLCCPVLLLVQQPASASQILTTICLPQRQQATLPG